MKRIIVFIVVALPVLADTQFRTMRMTRDERNPLERGSVTSASRSIKKPRYGSAAIWCHPGILRTRGPR
jgi:hypothetical protein